MNNYLRAIGIAVGIAATYAIVVWIGDKMIHTNETTPQVDSTATECCDTVQACDSALIYTYETDSCCKH